MLQHKGGLREVRRLGFVACSCGSPLRSPSKGDAAEDAAEDGNESVAAASVSGTPGTVKRVKKEEDRKAFIENDPLSGEVKPDAVFCKGCQAWVRLSTQTRYSLHPWKAHVQKCSGATK